MTLQLLNVLDDWTETLDNGHITDIIYIDFQKTFDSVPHKRLLSKIESYGIEGNILNWINTFLNNRRQRVLINGICSECKKVLSEVLQGSILGPILVVIYINDIINNLNSQAYLFEDDMKLYRRINNDTDYNVLRSDINKVVEWTQLWLLQLNPHKCKCITSINKKVNNQIYSLNTPLGVDELQKVNEKKDIGVVIDSSLKFKLHVAEKINRQLE